MSPPSLPPPSVPLVDRAELARFAWLSIGAAVTTVGLKTLAWQLTGSVGLLSDALESLVNLLAAVVALLVVKIAASPPDAEHQHGHDKAEYFSSGLEGALIMVAAISIVAAAIPRLFAPQPLEAVGLGLGVSAAASLVNLVVGRILVRTGKKHRSITLEADGHHLLTDVWTSVGVIVGVAAVQLTGLLWLDPVLAILVAVQILWTGAKLLRRSGMGLLDTSVPPEERVVIEAALDTFKTEGVSWHALRTRQSGPRRFIVVHVLVPGEWTVQRGHDMLERIEAALRETGPGTSVTTHMEPREDARAYTDQEL